MELGLDELEVLLFSHKNKLLVEYKDRKAKHKYLMGQIRATEQITVKKKH